MDSKIIRTEREFNSWFMNNYKNLGYSKIVRKDIGIFPDFIMLKGKKEVNVELETIASNFLLHKHDINKVHEIICIKNDLPTNHFSVPVMEIQELTFRPRIRRISAMIESETNEILNRILKKGRFRNKSHVIEEAIRFFGEEKYGKNKK